MKYLLLLILASPCFSQVVRSEGAISSVPALTVTGNGSACLKSGPLNVDCGTPSVTVTSSETVSGASGLGVTYGVTAGSITVGGNVLTANLANGAVGVGTASPLYSKLQITNTGAGVKTNTILDNEQAAAADVGSDLSFTGVGVITQGTIRSAWSGAATTDAYTAILTRGSNTVSEKVRVLGNGNVGIGTTNPASKLHISSGPVILDGTNPLLQITAPSGGSVDIVSAATGVRGVTGDKIARINFDPTTTNGTVQIRAENEGNGYGNTVLQGPGGLVGVGVIVPDEKLSVSGAIRAESNAIGFNGASGLLLDWNPSVNQARIVATRNGGVGQSSMTFNTYNGSAYVDAMDIIPNGSISSPSQPAVSASTGITNVVNAAWQTLNYSAKSFDTQNSMNSATGVWTAPATGVYMFVCSADFAANLAGSRGIRFVDGPVISEYQRVFTNANTVAGVDTNQQLYYVDSLVAGATRACQVYQTSGGSININSANMQAVKLW